MTLLREVADSIHVHESSFMQSNSVIVDGDAGVLLIDPGVRDSELAAIAHEVGSRGRALPISWPPGANPGAGSPGPG